MVIYVYCLTEYNYVQMLKRNNRTTLECTDTNQSYRRYSWVYKQGNNHTKYLVKKLLS